MQDIDYSLTQVFIDDIDMSNSADVRATNLTLSETSLFPGNHEIKVLLFNSNGDSYEPIVWNFYILGDFDIDSAINKRFLHILCAQVVKKRASLWHKS